MTQEELKVIEYTCDVANAFNKLPVYHIADAKDVAFHIHAIQAIVIQRDAVRLHPDMFRAEPAEKCSP